MNTDELIQEFNKLKIDIENVKQLTGKKNETQKNKLLAKETSFIESLAATENLSVLAELVTQNLENDTKGIEFEHLLHIVFSSDTVVPNKFISAWINKYSMDDYQLEQFIRICKEYDDTKTEHTVKTLNIKLGLNFLHGQYTELTKDLNQQEIQELHSVLKESDFMQVLTEIQETSPQLVKKQKTKTSKPKK